MKDNFESIVFNKILENSNILINGLESNFGRISKTGLITCLSFSATVTLDLIFQNKNYQNFDIDLFLELMVKRIRNTQIINVTIFKDELFNDSFFEEQINTSINYFNDLDYNKDLLLTDIDVFTKENLMLKINSLANLQNPTKKLSPKFQYNLFSSLYIFPLLNTLKNSSEKLETIKEHLESNTFFINNKSHFSIVMSKLQSSMIKNHSEIEFISAVKEFKGIIEPVKNETNKNCYIATLVYNDIEHPNVEFLRKYRDQKLSKSIFGQLFIKIYYKISPNLSRCLKPFKKIQYFIRLCLDNLILRIEKNLK